MISQSKEGHISLEDLDGQIKLDMSLFVGFQGNNQFRPTRVYYRGMTINMNLEGDSSQRAV
jgi:hypothetical protein